MRRTALVAALALTACGNSIPPEKRVGALSCLDLAQAALDTATTCDEARAALAKAVVAVPACAELFGLHLSAQNDAGSVIRCDD